MQYLQNFVDYLVGEQEVILNSDREYVKFNTDLYLGRYKKVKILYVSFNYNNILENSEFDGIKIDSKYLPSITKLIVNIESERDFTTRYLHIKGLYNRLEELHIHALGYNALGIIQIQDLIIGSKDSKKYPDAFSKLKYISIRQYTFERLFMPEYLTKLEEIDLRVNNLNIDFKFKFIKNYISLKKLTLYINTVNLRYLRSLIYLNFLILCTYDIIPGKKDIILPNLKVLRIFGRDGHVTKSDKNLLNRIKAQNLKYISILDSNFDINLSYFRKLTGIHITNTIRETNINIFSTKKLHFLAIELANENGVGNILRIQGDFSGLYYKDINIRSSINLKESFISKDYFTFRQAPPNQKTKILEDIIDYWGLGLPRDISSINNFYIGSSTDGALNISPEPLIKNAENYFNALKHISGFRLFRSEEQEKYRF